MYWKGAAEREFERFFEFAKTLGGEPVVVSTHRSKSISLPVVEVATPYGVRCIVRDNFHDIKVSVWCPEPCDHDLFGLPAGGDSYLSRVYFEGFQGEWIHDPFVLGAQKFSVCLGPLIPFAQALRWKFEPPEKDREKPKTPDNSWFDVEAAIRLVAVNSFFPVLYRRSTVSVLYRFFKPDEPIEPDEARLRVAFTRKAPNYKGVVEDTPIPYLDLDFTSGCPEPVDDWLRVLNKLVKERREDSTVDRLGDDIGARVNVYRLTPELRSRAEELGCLEMLRPPER